MGVSVLPDTFSPVLQALGQLYEVYHRPTADVYQYRLDIERLLHYLMLAYDNYLGWVMSQYIIRVDGESREIYNITSFAAQHFVNLAAEVTCLSEWLDTLGDMAQGGTLLERVQAVVRHYATQVGRMVEWNPLIYIYFAANSWCSWRRYMPIDTGNQMFAPLPQEMYCGHCTHLSVTEEEQTPRTPHICLALNEQVYHAGHHPSLPRLAACLEQGLKSEK
jgi:hypothetical protein